jgi:alkylation response protein AidB-like acyl-CoA dehydrogenase
MDFSLTEEQTLLADSVTRFIDNEYRFEKRQRIAASEEGYSRDMWRNFADLGWTAVPFPEADGGLGGGAIETTLLMEAFGRGLVLEPFLPTVVLAGGVLKRCATPAQKERWLLPLIGGELQAALAFAEPQGRFDPLDIVTTATADGHHFVINGRKALVPNGRAADLLVIPARTEGGAHDGTPIDRIGGTRDGTPIALFAVAADAAGVQRRGYRTVDGHNAAEIVLDQVRVPAGSVLGPVGGGAEILLDVLCDGTLALCAEAFGILRALQEKTVEYTKNRVQFSVPVASFQALQHRMVDMFIGREQIRSLLTWSVMLAAAGAPETRRAVSALKYQIGTTGRLIAQEAVQLHGGMGMTWELDIAHYFKRFSAIEILFGNADYHLDRFRQLVSA